MLHKKFTTATTGLLIVTNLLNLNLDLCGQCGAAAAIWYLLYAHTVGQVS